MELDERNLEEDPIYRDLFSFLEKIFRSHYLNIYDTFDSGVWFLHDDPEFYKNKITSQTTPNTTINPESYNLMHQILEQTSSNGNDFKRLKVNVSTFIRALIIELMKIQRQRLKISQKMNSFNIDENFNIIEQKIEKLNEDAYSSKADSYLKISLLKTENLPEGEYEVGLLLKKLKKNSLVDKGIVDNLLEIYTVGSSVRVNNKINDFKDCVFQKIKVSSVDINYSEFKPEEEILKIFSGTNLNSFQIEWKNAQDNTVFKSKNEEIIELYLKLIDFFCDLTKVTNDCILTLMLNPDNFKKPTKNEIKLSINLNFLIDNNVRKSVLERIHYIFKLSINYRSMVENNLNTLIKPFGKHGEQIKSILEKENVEPRSECCGGKCNIF